MAESKVVRELARAGNQLGDLFSGVLDRLATRRHDHNFASAVRILTGDVAVLPNIALFLIYQPRGVAASVLATCEHLAARGYAPVVVSNTPLSDADCAGLLARSARLMIRPNFGYDFGGYRDGLRLIAEAGFDPERVLILNDSIWFPLNGSETLLARMEATGSDFIGPMFEKKGNRDHRAHYESHFLLIGRKARECEAFRRYWREYPVSDTRRKVLQAGEKGLSQTMFGAGFAPVELASRRLFIAFVATAPADFLRKTLEYAAYAEPLDAAARDDLLANDGPDWINQARSHIAKLAEGGIYHDTFHHGAAKVFDMPFLKKKRDRAQTVEMRRQFLRAVDAGDLPAPDAVMLGEIRASVPA